MTKKILLCIIILFLCGCDRHTKDVISIFPLKNYNQSLYAWIKPSAPDYNQLLIPSVLHQQRLANFYKHTYGASSPWNSAYVQRVLNEPAPDDLKTTEQAIFTFYNNRNKPTKELGYGENYIPYTENWIKHITANIDLSQLKTHYLPQNRAIAIDNLNVRTLPTEDVYFYHYKIAGEGYPFDHMQISALWTGTPVYILMETRDHAWSLILTGDYIGWVKSNGIARVSEAFIKNWVDAAFKQLAAITRTKTSIIDNNGLFHFVAYIGSVFPVQTNKATSLTVMIPTIDSHRQAVLAYADIPKTNASIIPLAPTPHNFSYLMSTLIGRPYGWGNLYFYNDCSSELKNLFVPFGIWLPRHSSDQVYAGKMTDLSQENLDYRMEYLLQHGQRFTSLVYIDGHVFLYIGNYPNPNSHQHELIPMTYQNMWGLRPKPGTRRAVIGKAVIFPLLKHYPEDLSLLSQAGKKHFQVTQLGETATQLEKIEVIDLHDLMYP